MSIKIGHAAKDERNKYNSGSAGDQTKQEVHIREWYNRPWNVIIRFKDPAIAEKIAYAMERACNNDKIGYDQYQRNTLLKKARAVGYDPGKVTEKCECDCSSLVSVCCMYAGIPESTLYKGGNSATTRTLKSWLNATGLVELLTASKYRTKDIYLKRGDILLYEGHHVAVALEDGSKAEPTTTKGGTTTVNVTLNVLKNGSKGKNVKALQILLNGRGYNCGTADGDFGAKTLAAVKAFQKAKSLEVDGIVGANTWKTLLA